MNGDELARRLIELAGKDRIILTALVGKPSEPDAMVATHMLVCDLQGKLLHEIAMGLARLVFMVERQVEEMMRAVPDCGIDQLVLLAVAQLAHEHASGNCPVAQFVHMRTAVPHPGCCGGPGSEGDGTCGRDGMGGDGMGGDGIGGGGG